MSTPRYLFLMTFWVIVSPAVVVTLPASAVGMVMSLAMAEWWTLAFTLPALGVCIALWHYWIVFLGKLHDAAEEGTLPDDFTVQNLPFVLPIVYCMLVIAAGYVISAGQGEQIGWFEPVEVFILAAEPHFAFVNLAVIGLGSFLFDLPGWQAGAFFVLGMTVVSDVLWWEYHGRRKLPASRKTLRGAGVFVLLMVLAGGAIYTGRATYHQYVLPRHPWRGGETVVMDEEGAHDYLRRRTDKTDLSVYRPFSGNNKLPKVDSPTLTISENHPKMHGALALFPIYAAAADAIYEGSIRVLQAHYVRDYVDAGTSPEAFSALLSGQADMVFMLRPSEAQMAEAEKRGKTLEITPLGREAFVFFVSHVNPVDDLSSAQIRDIYAKKIRRWDEVGGKPERILAFQRPAGSGSQTAMERFMGSVPLPPPVKEEFQVDMGGIVNRVADYRNYGNAVGYSFRYYVTTMFQHDGVKVIAVDGVPPTVENIRSGAYPLGGELVVVTLAGNENPHVPALIAWFLSPQGQRLIEEVGYVGL